ncbi:hypothetical protein CEXT_759451 [Caerostris extrusa]|uniref:Uncharacterized protein n=1 Tax=Caerostris extrusa TaxID=172846 RepID=A0AAV4PLT2_CAEEX|nr:hypothetical protein CEXT_759451 [Caerostris extrusa]
MLGESLFLFQLYDKEKSLRAHSENYQHSQEIINKKSIGNRGSARVPGLGSKEMATEGRGGFSEKEARRIKGRDNEVTMWEHPFLGEGLSAINFRNGWRPLDPRVVVYMLPIHNIPQGKIDLINEVISCDNAGSCHIRLRF